MGLGHGSPPLPAWLTGGLRCQEVAPPACPTPVLLLPAHSHRQWQELAVLKGCYNLFEFSPRDSDYCSLIGPYVTLSSHPATLLPSPSLPSARGGQEALPTSVGPKFKVKDVMRFGDAFQVGQGPGRKELAGSKWGREGNSTLGLLLSSVDRATGTTGWGAAVRAINVWGS